MRTDGAIDRRDDASAAGTTNVDKTRVQHAADRTENLTERATFHDGSDDRARHGPRYVIPGEAATRAARHTHAAIDSGTNFWWARQDLNL